MDVERWWRPALVGATAVLSGGLLGGCVGALTEPGGGADVEVPGPREAAETFTCDEAAQPDDGPLRRLSAVEHRRTLHDLLALTTDDATARAVLADVDDALTRLPADARSEPVPAGAGAVEARYGRLVQTVSQARVDGHYELALAVGGALASDPTRLEALMGRCATDADPANDAACLDGLVDSFASAAFRAPLDPDERAFLRDEAYIDGDVVSPEGVGELIAVVLMSPRFLYRVELGAGPPDAGRVALSDHELATRLSYQLWGTMPDAELFAAAEAGELSTAAGLEVQVDRMLDDPRAEEVMAGFVEEWLGVAELEPLDTGVGSPRFDAFFGGLVPDATLHEDMRRELADFTVHTVFAAEGTLGDLFTSTAAFPRTDGLASIYGVPRWEPGQAPVALPARERAGLLTRAATLAVPSVSPHPILRGVEVRRYVICDELPPPPPDLEIPDVDGAMGSRETAEVLTSPAACQACHRDINALGYALSHYDALGRYITTERLLDEDGALVGEVAIDASSRPAIGRGDDETVSDGVELSALLATSGKVEACFARHYFRFTHRRVEDLDRDGCALERMREALAGGASVRELMREVALSPELRTRAGGE